MFVSKSTGTSTQGHVSHLEDVAVKATIVKSVNRKTHPTRPIRAPQRHSKSRNFYTATYNKRAYLYNRKINSDLVSSVRRVSTRCFIDKQRGWGEVKIFNEISQTDVTRHNTGV